MSTRLTIGLVDDDAGWIELLRQIGVRFGRLDWNRLDARGYSAIITNRPLSPDEASLVEAYLRAGGAVLDTGGVADRLSLATRTRSVRRIVDARSPFERTWLVDVENRIESLDEAGSLARTVALGEHGGGWLAHVPFDVGSIVRDFRMARRRFHAPSGHHPDEIVARIPLHPYRVIVESALEWLHARRGLPYAHLWYFPDDARSVFAYRIDSDYGTPEHMLRLRAIADDHGVPMTLFLHVGAHEEHIGLFRDFAGHELAAHGYRHRTFSSYEANWGNIAEARQVMAAAGLHPTGFAAPTGRWNRGLDRALADQGFSYSSEFTLDYDGLPFFPIIGARRSSVLQMPIHPVSVGNLARAHAPAGAVDEYYQAVIDRQLAHRAPVILYHHPLQEAWSTVAAIFERARAEGIAMTTMGAYAAWWRERDAARFEASVDDDEVTLSVPAAADRLCLRIVAPDGREAFVPTGRPGVPTAAEQATNVEHAIALASLPWRAAPDSITPPSNLAAIRRPTLTMLRHSLEDAIARFRQ